MRPQLFNSLRHYIACLLVVLPAMAIAQPKAPDMPCPSAMPSPAPSPMPEPAAAPVVVPQTGAQPQPDVDLAAYDTERRKSFEKTYQVNKSDVLSIENKFGNVVVNTWSRSEIQVQVEIIGRAGSEQAVQTLLNKIKIAESRSGNTIAVKTEMGSISSSGSNKKGVEVNYTINMPADNQIKINNSYGYVYLPDMKGKVDLTVRYGAFKAGHLSNADNSIKASYCSSSVNTISYLNKGVIDLAYSSMNLGGTNGINGSSKYSDLMIGSLRDALDMDVRYGNFRVENVQKNFKNISVNGGYAPIQLHFADDAAFDFNVNVSFADFKFDKNLVQFTTLQRGHTSAEYKGKYGNSSPKGSINITSKFDDVKFMK